MWTLKNKYLKKLNHTLLTSSILLMYSFLINAQSITVIGTCEGIIPLAENTYNIRISGLNAATTYNFDLDGDNNNEVFNFTGATVYTTSIANNTNIMFTNGTASLMVQIDEDANGSYDNIITVHEVLCTDADNDGDLDFSEGCDEDLNGVNRGYIVSTVAPYNSANVYVYVLTNSSNNALAANTSGLFTGLVSGKNGSITDYNVVALNFFTNTEALTFIAGLTLDVTTGTVVTSSSTPSGCSMVCGIMSYNIECPIATTLPIPTMSEWGLLILGLLILNLGVFFVHRLGEINLSISQ